MSNDRFILPNSAETACEIWLEGQKVDIKFFSSNGKNLGSKSFLIVAIKEDDIVNHLASSEVNFTTFSALYDGAALIVTKVKELKEAGGESSQKVVLRRKTDEETQEETSAEGEAESQESAPETPVDLANQPLSFETRDLGKIIHHTIVPYTKDVYLFVFQVTRLAYTLVFEKAGQEVYRAELKGIPEETDVYPALQNSGLEAFETMSVVFDIAEAVSKACKNSDSFEKEVPEDIKKRVELSKDLSKIAKKVAPKKEEHPKDETASVEAKSKQTQAEPISDATFLFTFDVPYSESSLDFYMQGSDVLTVFKKEGTEVSRKTITGVPSEDEGYAIVDASGISDTFSSMSLIYTVSEKIVEVCTEPKKFLPKVETTEDEVEPSSMPIFAQEEEEKTTEAVIEEVVDEEKLKLKAIVEGGSFITELKIPYSHETSLKIYFDESTGQFALRFWRGGKEVDLFGVDKSLNEDQAWELLNKANIQFISMSVIYDAAEDILKVLANPDEYKKTVSSDVEDEVDISLGGEAGETEEDKAIDYSKFTKPEDIEALLEIIKKSIGKSKKPILILESEIKTMPKVGFKVLRQGESTWLIDFYSTKDGSTISQRPAKLKAISSDEIFKAVNNGIPQVTLSAVSDASEFVFDIVKHLADRPADDLAFNQVVTHFEKLINEHEEKKEFKDAIDLTEGLMQKLASLGNASGYSKFGLKLAKLLESQDKTADSAKLRLDVIPKLSEMRDLQALRDFVDDTVELFQQTTRPLDAAQVSVDLAEVVLKRKDLTLAMNYIKQASTFYKEANISRALADHNFRFGKLFLQILRGDQPEDFFVEDLRSDSAGSNIDQNSDDLVSADDPFANLGEDPFANLEESTAVENESEQETEQEKKTPEQEGLGNPLELYDIKERSLQSLLDDTVELFKDSLSIYESGREQNEKIDTITEIILLYRKYKFEPQEIIFADMGVDILKDNGQNDRALRLALQSIDKLLVKDGDITKGLEFFNDAIKLFYEKHQVKQALDLSVKIVPKLIAFGEEETTLEYVGFTSGILDRIYPQPVEEALPYYLQIAQFYTSLKKQQESLDLLGKAIIFKQKNIEGLLDFCHEFAVKYLENQDFNVARDFINSALNVIGVNDYPTIHRVSYQFFKDLTSFGNFEMGMQYLTYAYQLTNQLPDPLNSAGSLVVDAIQHFLSLKDVKNLKEYINPLLPILKSYFTQTQQYTQIKGILEPIIFRYIENENWSDVVENARDLSNYLQQGQQLTQAGEILISVRNKLFDKVSNDVIREFTDASIKLLINEYPETQDKGIEVLDPYIEYLLKNNNFSDAYVYTVQAVKYFESQKKIFEATEFIKDKQAKFADKNRHQDVNSLSDLIIRLNKQAADLNTVADIAFKSYKENLSTKNWEACYGYLTESANIFLNMGDDKRTEEILNEGFDIFIKEPDAEDETDELVTELVKFNRSIRKFTDLQVLDFYKSTIAKSQKTNSHTLMNKVITRTITLIKEKFPDRFYDEMTEIIANLFKAGLHKDAQPYVSELITSYSHDLNFIRDLLFYYVKEFLKGNEVEIGQKLVEMVLEKSKHDSGNVIRITMRFVQMLAEYRLSGQARSYIDKIVQNLFPTTSMDQTQSLAVATIYDKFSSMVVKGSPELAIEYGYKAADLYRKVINYDKMIEVYGNLVANIDEEETVRGVLKRATSQADQLKLPFHKQYLLQVQLVYKNFETRAPRAEREFVQVLGKFEKESMLKESAEYLQQSFYRMIRNNEFDLFYKYIEYLLTLINGLKSQSKGQKILVQLAARYYNKKGDKKKVAKLKTIYDSINEPNPSDELLAHFLKTGELELPPEPIKPVIAPEMKEVVVEVKEKTEKIKEKEVKIEAVKTQEPVKATVSSTADVKKVEEVVEPQSSQEIVQSVTQSIMESKGDQEEADKSAASLEDELLEIGGDALSQALADAISQLTSTNLEEEEEKEPKKEEKKKSQSKDKPKFQSGFGEIQKSSSSSMDLSNFDSLAELEKEKREKEERKRRATSKLSQMNPNDTNSLENLFSNALSDLSKNFGTADIPSASEDEKKDKKDKKKKK